MAKIGIFTKDTSGEFTGEIITLSVQSTNVRIVPIRDADTQDAPSHCIMVGSAEIGTAWTRRGASETYLDVTLDDPSFTAPINATLVEDRKAGVFRLIWER